jgi:hypothetical protein
MNARMRNRISRVGLALAAVVIVGAVTAAHGAITEKVAIKQVKAAVKTRIGLLASALAAARLTVAARVDAFEVATAGGFSVSDVQPLVDDLATFQAAVQEALFDVAVDLAADGKTALAALADGGPLAAIPPALANLPGGVPEQARAAIAKLLAKTYRAVNKRLAKTSALVGKDGDATFFALVDAPPQLFFAFSEGRSDAILFGFALDLRVSASTTTSDATRLWVGGTTAVAGQNLVVSAVPMVDGALGEDVQVTSEGRGRFLAAFGAATPLPRSNYLVGAAAGISASAPSSFAVR